MPPKYRYTYDDRPGAGGGLVYLILLAALLYAGWDVYQHGLRLPTLHPTGETRAP